MKMVITGHTKGIGKFLYDKFKEAEWEVVGLSRSNGYDINKDFDKVVEAAAGCDLFINNAYRDQQQTKLVWALKDRVKRMIVMGSVSRLYPDLIATNYVQDKQELSEACRLISLQPDSIDILHFDMSFIENTEVDLNEPTDFTSDYVIKYQEIADAVDFWMNNPKVRQMEFLWKLTPFVYEQLKRANPNLDPSRITI